MGRGSRSTSDQVALRGAAGNDAEPVELTPPAPLTIEQIVETDTALADLYNQAAAIRARRARYESTALSTGGAKYRYRGKQRVPDITLEVAIERLEAELLNHADDEYGYGRLAAPCSPSGSVGHARTALQGMKDMDAELAGVEARMEPLEVVYAENGWNRYFLVTSSQGHVHRSMSCSTCNPRTTYGWLPELSGKTEAQAVQAHGPALCSVCFPSAPVEWTGAKITKATAAKAAH